MARRRQSVQQQGASFDMEAIAVGKAGQVGLSAKGRRISIPCMMHVITLECSLLLFLKEVRKLGDDNPKCRIGMLRRA